MLLKSETRFGSLDYISRAGCASVQTDSSCSDQIATEEIVEINPPLHIGFVDLVKAFDDTNESLWKLLRQNRLPREIINLIM